MDFETEIKGVEMNQVKINLHGYLDDCKFISYYLSSENVFTLEIQTWNLDKLMLIFDKPIMFIDHSNGGVAEFCYGSSEAPILQQSLANHHLKVAQKHTYKLFQILTLDDNLSFEIISTHFDVIKNPHSSSHIAMELSRQLKDQNDLDDIAKWSANYLFKHAEDLTFELRELLHCISLMRIYWQLRITNEELKQLIDETFIDVNDHGKLRPKPTTKMMSDRTYRFINELMKKN